MAIIIPVPVDPGPPVPSSTDPQATFDSMFEASLSWQRNQLVPQVNALVAGAYTNAQETQMNADEALADRIQTGLDRAQTGLDRTATGLDKAGTAADRVQTGLDKAATAADRVQTGQDRVATAADRVQTGQDRVATAAARDQAQIYATQQLTGTSSTANTPGVGSKTFATQTAKAFVAGMYLSITSAGAPENRIGAYITSYDPATGALVVNANDYSGSASRTDWVIGLGASGNFVSRNGDTMSGALNWAPSVDVASAATTAIGGANSNLVRVTGTTTITSLGAITAGVCRTVTFAGSLVLTHNATSLILPAAGANITTAAGDVAEFESLGGGNWRCTDYQRADGTALVAPPVVVTPGVKTSAFTAANTEKAIYPCDTTGGAFTATMPAAPQPGWLVTFIDHKQNFAVANLTLDPNGKKFYGSAENYVLNQKGRGRTFLYVNDTIGWVVYA